MAADGPQWPAEARGPEASWRGQKGPKGDKGEPGEGMTRGARHAFIYLTSFFLLVALAALIIGARQVGAFNKQEAELRAQQHALAVQQAALRKAQLAQCGANQSIGDIAHLKVTLNPATGKASKAGIQIFSANREAWRGLGCPGHLAPPSPSYRHWAAMYHLPAS